MHGPKKVSRYLVGEPQVTPLPEVSEILHVEPMDTLPPGKLQPPPDQQPQRDFDDESLRIHSLTPVKVLEKIRNDLITVLGIKGSIAGKFTRLEQKLVDYLERIVRKGQCPSILVKDRDLIELLLCLKKYFETESVSIAPDEANPQAIINIPVFPALYKYAKDAAFCEQRIRELRQERSRTTNQAEKEKIDHEVHQLRERKDSCLIYYQKIIFSDADNLKRNNAARSITLYGKPITLDDLLIFLKKGGRLDQARESTPEPQVAQQAESTVVESTFSQVPEESLGTFEQTGSADEVVDWRKIKSGSGTAPAKDPESPHYSFNL